MPRHVAGRARLMERRRRFFYAVRAAFQTQGSVIWNIPTCIWMPRCSGRGAAACRLHFRQVLEKELWSCAYAVASIHNECITLQSPGVWFKTSTAFCHLHLFPPQERCFLRRYFGRSEQSTELRCLCSAASSYQCACMCFTPWLRSMLVRMSALVVRLTPLVRNTPYAGA